MGHCYFFRIANTRCIKFTFSFSDSSSDEQLFNISDISANEIEESSDEYEQPRKKQKRENKRGSKTQPKEQNRTTNIKSRSVKDLTRKLEPKGSPMQKNSTSAPKTGNSKSASNQTNVISADHTNQNEIVTPIITSIRGGASPHTVTQVNQSPPNQSTQSGGVQKLLPDHAVFEIIKALGLSVQDIQKHGGTVAISVPQNVIKGGVLDLTKIQKVNYSASGSSAQGVPEGTQVNVSFENSLGNSSKY